MKFKALVTREDNGQFVSRVEERAIDDLPAGEVLIRVDYSSVNYKDVLSSKGNRGVSRQYPHTPGIDAAGRVVKSQSSAFAEGEAVLVMGYDLGMNTAGGFGQYIRVPADWVLRRPAGLDAKSAMIYGTAGFTAAMSVSTLEDVGIRASQGRVLVTGASGGVGSVAVALLAQLGFEVEAVTGNSAAHSWLRELGAADILERDALLENAHKPMHKVRWAAAVDSVGGEPLANILKSIQYGGSVTCCGLAASAQLPASVLPFILRGINLMGIDSVELPRAIKQQVWDLLAGEWRLAKLDALLARTVSLDELPGYLASQPLSDALGRTIVAL